MLKDVIIPISTAIISGLLGVIISTIYYRRYEGRKLKFETLRKIIGYRMFLLDNEINEKNKEFYGALNEIFLVFNDNKKVIEKLEIMHKDLGDQKKLLDNLLKLIKEICKELNIKFKDLNDSFITKPFAK